LLGDVTPPPTVPSAPTGLAATAGNAQVALVWTAPGSNGGSAISGYNVYRGTSAGAETFLAATGSTPAYADTTAVNGTTYYYVVRAVNAVGESPASNEASATPVAAPTNAFHIGDLDNTSTRSSRNWTAKVLIRAEDASHAFLSGVVVTGTWSAGATGTVSCTTGASGMCTVQKKNLNLSLASVTFTVANATRSGWTYVSTANHDPDAVGSNASNGTMIVVARPS
jgi:predicted phage tail protein